MQRILMDRLVEWKDDLDRKPLILTGIKHSGKTYLLREFGTKYYKDIAYFNFNEDRQLSDLFSNFSNPSIILKNLSIYLEKDIKPKDTLIILDEIHLCPDALESLKFFCDRAPEYHVTAITPYLDISLPQNFTIPVGKVDCFTLYPMSFLEFLLAQSPMLALHLRETGFKEHPYKVFQKQIEDKFLDYQITGGMPEVVQAWLDTKSIEAVDKLQTQLLRSIESDFAGLCPMSLLSKLIAVFNAIPAQLIKGNRKFMFTKVNKNWRGKDLDDAVYWLIRAGLAYKVEHIEKPEVPLLGQVNPAHFKLYMCDVGLLRRAGGFPSSAILSRDSSGSGIKGALAENIVCSDLKRIYSNDLYYWSAENPGKAEVDFIVQDGASLIPVEVKAGSAGRARSLVQYKIRFNPKKSVLTGTDTDKDDILPLYGFWNLEEWLRFSK